MSYRTCYMKGCTLPPNHGGEHDIVPPSTAPAQVGERYVAQAQKLWDAILDADECCIGHPDGAEFVEEKIVPKIAAFLAQFSIQATRLTGYDLAGIADKTHFQCSPLTLAKDWQQFADAIVAALAQFSVTLPELPKDQLADIIAEKTKELEAAGLCKWKYACPYCLEGNTPIRSSVSDAMVHHTSVGRVLCEGRDKPTVFGSFRKDEPPKVTTGARELAEKARAYILLNGSAFAGFRSDLYAKEIDTAISKARKEVRAAERREIVEWLDATISEGEEDTTLLGFRNWIEPPKPANPPEGAALTCKACRVETHKVDELGLCAPCRIVRDGLSEGAAEKEKKS